MGMNDVIFVPMRLIYVVLGLCGVLHFSNCDTCSMSCWIIAICISKICMVLTLIFVSLT